MNIFRNLKLYYKIFTLIIVALVMLITVGIYSVMALFNTVEQGRSMYNNQLVPISELGFIAKTAENTRVNAATMEQQSASMQEINGMAENLASMAEQLNTSIAKFKY